ncbi:MAG TPA: methyltransferase domain-containing protein [Anaerolineae bacterium]|jgi:SAM-dependent methyltransferase
MIQTLSLPSLNPIPENIETQLQDLLRQTLGQPSPDPALGDWLLDLVKNSGHLSNPDDMRWRVLSVVWLVTQFDAEQAWPYLAWLNIGEPVISNHLCEILSEAANDLNCHVQLATWIAGLMDERLVTFFSEYRHLPAAHKMPGIMHSLLADPTAATTGTWLAKYCQDARGHISPHIRRWYLVAAAWYATCFDSMGGLNFLQEFSSGSPSLAPADNKLLMDTVSEINGLGPMIGWLAACPDAAVKTMLRDFGHPDLTTVAEETLDSVPDYEHLTVLADQAAEDIAVFKRNVTLLAEASLALKSVTILNLACGLLAPQTILMNSAGYKTVGVDLHLPPRYLPLPTLKYWLKRRQHAKAWQAATAPYYEALARQAGLKLKWTKARLELADLTRLKFVDSSFGLVICTGYLHLAPDINSLLAEAVRALQPGGLLLADFRPYPALTGAFQPPETTSPWAHLRSHHHHLTVPLNQWREAQYRATFENHFTITHWLTEQDEPAQAHLTPELRAELADYSEDELTRKEIVVLATVQDKANS